MLNPHLFRTDYLSQKRSEISDIAIKRFRQGYTLESITKRTDPLQVLARLRLAK